MRFEFGDELAQLLQHFGLEFLKLCSGQCRRLGRVAAWFPKNLAIFLNQTTKAIFQLVIPVHQINAVHQSELVQITRKPGEIATIQRR